MKKLYKTLQIFTLFTAFSAVASPPIEKHPVDNFDIGIPSSSSQKQFIFDLGLGASNPNLGVDTSVQGLNYNKNIFQLGDGTTSQKTVTANIGNGSTNPKIIWDNTNSTWSFSNDGTNFSAFGSGSGGASGIQLLTNGDFESGITLGWTNTGGTFAVATSGSNLLVGKKSATFTASGSGQSVQSSLYTIPNGLTGQACAASMLYKGGDVGLTFEVLDNSSNILASQIIQASTSAQTISLPFQCPSSGSIQLKILSSAPAALIAFDQMFLGQNTLIALSQATYYGGVNISGGCQLIVSTSGSPTYQDMAQSGSNCNTNTVNGNVTSYNTSTGGFNLNNAPPGEYEVLVQGTCQRGNASGNTINFRITDGTTNSTDIAVAGPAGVVYNPCTFVGHFSYQSAGNHAFKFQAYSAPGADNAEMTWADPGEGIQVYKFPSQSELAVRAETINWNVAFTNPFGLVGLSLGNTGGDALISGGSAVGVNVSPGTIHALTACTGTNPPTDGTPCTGNSHIGVVYNQPAAGIVRACVNFSDFSQVNNASEIQYSYKIIQTDANNSSSILNTGQNVQSNTWETNTAGAEVFTSPYFMCDNFYVASAGLTSFRLVYNQQLPGGTVSVREITGDGALGGRNILWTVTPVTQNVPAPVLTFQPVAFRVHGVPSGSYGTGSVTQGVVWSALTGYDFDTNTAYNTSTGEYIIPVAGLWSFSCSISISASQGFQFQEQANVLNNSTSTFLSTNYQWWSGAGTVTNQMNPMTTWIGMLPAGQHIQCAALANVSGSWATDPSEQYFQGYLIR